MEIRLNGDPFQITPAGPEGRAPTLEGLMVTLDLLGKRVAVEVNGELVPRSLHAQHVLAEGDRVEVVHAIGGG